MSSPIQLYSQLFQLLSQYSVYKDLRHLKILAWMIQALLLSGKINLGEWEPYIQCRATQAQRQSRMAQSVARRDLAAYRSLREKMPEISKQLKNQGKKTISTINAGSH